MVRSVRATHLWGYHIDLSRFFILHTDPSHSFPSKYVDAEYIHLDSYHAIQRVLLACGDLVPWAISGRPMIHEWVVVVGQSSLCLVALPGPLQQQLQLLRHVIRVMFGCVLTTLKPIKSLCDPIELVI